MADLRHHSATALTAPSTTRWPHYLARISHETLLRLHRTLDLLVFTPRRYSAPAAGLKRHLERPVLPHYASREKSGLAMVRAVWVSALICAVWLLLVNPLHAQADAGASRVELRAELERLLDDPATSNAFVGVLVVDLESRDTLFAQYPDHSFVPASNAKLFTTAAALDQLGPVYQYETRVYATGSVRDGILFGDLVVRGSGDPTIAPRFHAGDAGHVFAAWADSLHAIGIDSIAGRIIGDDDVFDDRGLGTGWSWDDIPYWYSAEASGLSFHDNSVDVTVRTGTPGSRPSISWEPYDTGFITWENHLQTTRRGTERDEDYGRALAGNVFTLTGSLPARAVDRTSLAVHDPTGFFVTVLLERLHHHGIGVRGPAVDVDDLAETIDYDTGTYRRIATYTSPPLNDIIEAVNKRSHNLYAEQLLKTLGAERPVNPDEPHFHEQEPGSSAMGIAAATRTWALAGVDTSRFRLVDGSGLSRMNLVTPRGTIALLAYLWDHPDPAVKVSFYQSLPIGGVDGTLRRRFHGEAAATHVRAKTGTLTGVSALSGYVSRTGAEPLAFAIFSNHHTTDAGDARDLQDAIVNALSRYRN